MDPRISTGCSAPVATLWRLDTRWALHKEQRGVGELRRRRQRWWRQGSGGEAAVVKPSRCESSSMAPDCDLSLEVELPHSLVILFASCAVVSIKLLLFYEQAS